MYINAIKPLEKHIYLASPTMHGEEMDFMREAYDTNWMSTTGSNIREVERISAEMSGVNHAVALSCCTAALHLCAKFAGGALYGMPKTGHGALEGKYVFCSDMTFSATLNPVVYEGGIPIFIDTEPDTWNMDPTALEKAFERYPDVKLVVLAHLYGFPAKISEIKAICEKHGALLIEDAAEAMGATYRGQQCGSFGDYSAISFNGNKIITGSSGGCLLTNDLSVAEHARKLSTQARENAPWYQHEEIGYNYRMSNVIAGVVRGQYPHLYEHIAQKQAIWERYRDGLKGLPVSMNPFDAAVSVPNYWLSAMLIDEKAMCVQTRGELAASFAPEHGKTCPTEILDAIRSVNAEGRPIWKPMHLQPTFRGDAFVAAESGADVGADIFARGLCLPSDNKMKPEEQDRVIAAICACFE